MDVPHPLSHTPVDFLLAWVHNNHLWTHGWTHTIRSLSSLTRGSWSLATLSSLCGGAHTRTVRCWSLSSLTRGSWSLAALAGLSGWGGGAHANWYWYWPLSTLGGWSWPLSTLGGWSWPLAALWAGHAGAVAGASLWFVCEREWGRGFMWEDNVDGKWQVINE